MKHAYFEIVDGKKTDTLKMINEWQKKRNISDDMIISAQVRRDVGIKQSNGDIIYCEFVNIFYRGNKKRKIK